MSGMFSLFGTKKAPPSHIEAIHTLQTQIENIEKRQEHLDVKINKEKANIKALSQTNRRAAIAALKRMKMFENQRNQLDGTRDTLEMQKFALESSVGNMDNLQAIQVGVAAGKVVQAKINADIVDDVMDEARDQIDEQQQVANAMSQQLGVYGDMDQDELEAELDALTQQDVDAEFLEIGAQMPAVPATRVGPAATPAVPAAAAAKPAKAPAESEDDRAFRELEASMAM
eukprot:c14072_g1_i1.p1 GENE.c14072_g1_i1~~c14072_g1_i1.p1  ORF type:complete len:229 (-),score=61.56 c14072_g1_i1:205-891(-)